MKLFNKSSRGFTLIELLVVVAIIGILAAIILASLAGARAKARDAKVKSELSSLRAQMELFYNSNGFSYVPAGSGQVTSCQSGPYAAGSTDNAYNLINGIQIDVGGYSNMGCYADVDSWVAFAKVSTTTSGGQDYWCVDSGGQSKLTNGTYIDTPSFSCP